MSVQQSDLVRLSERLLIACDKSLRRGITRVGQESPCADLDDTFGTTFLPPFAFDFPVTSPGTAS